MQLHLQIVSLSIDGVLCRRLQLDCLQVVFNHGRSICLPVIRDKVVSIQFSVCEFWHIYLYRRKAEVADCVAFFNDVSVVLLELVCFRWLLFNPSREINGSKGSRHTILVACSSLIVTYLSPIGSILYVVPIVCLTMDLVLVAEGEQ